jgi:hypothetical protein
MHKELLELISTLSDGTISDITSSVYTLLKILIRPNGCANRYIMTEMVHRIGMLGI